MAHDFDDSLSGSHRAERHPLWGMVYRCVWPDVAGITRRTHDLAWQLSGVDVAVERANGQTIYIDEKIRGRSKTGRIFRDIALEIWSDRDRQVEGWAVKASLTDYVAYANAPAGVCYMLPVDRIRRAIACFARDYPKVLAFNESRTGRRWVTVSYAVPVRVLEVVVGPVTAVQFMPFEVGYVCARCDNILGPRGLCFHCP